MTDITTFLAAALAEDIGSGDVTANATIPEGMKAKFAMRARHEMVLAGLVYLAPLAQLVSKEITVTLHVADGDKVAIGSVLAMLEGPARALLALERTALNLVQQLSGVATLTRRYVDAVAGTSAQILDTRKTIPGMRVLQKYAVKCGGGVNHRMGLYDAVLIKDNHIAVAGGVAAAVKAAQDYVRANGGTSGVVALRSQVPPPTGGRLGGGQNVAVTVPNTAPHPTSPLWGEESTLRVSDASDCFTIQVECDTLAQVHEAIEAGATMLLLDNMSNEQLREAVALAKPHHIVTEASGNVNLDTVRSIAETGVDRISIGRLTHSAPAVDIGLDEA